ncbi:hypothetical protein [Acanthopleuribacter pedis]|uniref:Uncharacterized protein n=1 Tax=Acanthopleuribacter pedis TaxID=442870 RepID=A0A8J7Q3J9_9BACT|nr:hypothetical protein [Acanthopleuribacter pedis]MBO1317427.1 hypothetical protein [Acanthopleuribacter pedis]
MSASSQELIEVLSRRFPFGLDAQHYLVALDLVRPSHPDRRLTRLLAQLSGKKRHQVLQDIYRGRSEHRERPATRSRRGSSGEPN